MTDLQTLQSRLDFIGIDNATREALRELRPLIGKVLPGLLEQFYAHVGKYPHLAKMFSTPAAMRHAKQAQHDHWMSLATAKFDDAYVKSVTRIGMAHNRMGLEPRWYIAGYSLIVTGLQKAIETEIADGWFGGQSAREKKAALQAAITKAAMIDMDLAISVYLDAAKTEQHVAMQRMADEFEATVGQIINKVHADARTLEVSANTLTKTAEQTQQLSSSAASASGQVSTNVQSVASAAEEMTSSVHEIGRQVRESTTIAKEAVRQIEQTDVGISELSRTAERIGDVLKLITSIAAQTNLLALNATIEAARAGDAGRGFAVVASEVKALASQTAKATEEIGQQIEGIQNATQSSVASIKQIGGTIQQISEIAAGIAAAVEQQGAATGQISRNVQEVAGGTARVAGNIDDVSKGASATGTASSQVLSSAHSLSRESDHLKDELDKFLRKVRAA
ncbi:MULTISPECIES: globin-coupled sensor protein [unclassified Bradyrhizobium]|uniref:globin-coupled sensor protein n=1 Tax=unclassified Bradyrhizobium TaxID=2631580 RepID=UPI0028E983D8|nr:MULTISPECIES: globin-coupled sensor protein [unclassified Bradyrhizobium]